MMALSLLTVALLLVTPFIRLAQGVNDGDLRLVTDFVPTQVGFAAGRLEIFINGEWGTVNGQFSPLAANIACQQLGYNRQVSYGYIPTLQTNFPNLQSYYPYADSDSPIHLTDISCHADYSSDLLNCHHNAIGSVPVTARHYNDIGLNCTSCSQFLCSDGSCRSLCTQCPGYNPLLPLQIQCPSEYVTASPTPGLKLAVQGDLRLYPGQKNNGFTSGRLEIFLNGQWSTICATYASFVSKFEADLACRQMGFQQARDHGISISNRFPPESSVVPSFYQANELNCHGFTDHKTLFSCAEKQPASTISCSFDKLLGLNCSDCPGFLCPEGSCGTECDGKWDCVNGEDEERLACSANVVINANGQPEQVASKASSSGLESAIVVLLVLILLVIVLSVGAFAGCVYYHRKSFIAGRGYSRLTAISEPSISESGEPLS